MNSNIISQYGIFSKKVFWNLQPKELEEISIRQKDAKKTDLGAISVNTGKFTGRSPKDRFIVNDKKTRKNVFWSNINIPIESNCFDLLYKEMTDYLLNKDIYVRDAFACDHPKHKLKVRIINEYPWSNLFCYNMFLRPNDSELKEFDPSWLVLNVPGFKADPKRHGTRQENFSIINFTKKIVIIGGTAYTGEIKKSIFSVLNFTLPFEKNILSMHCSGNVGDKGDTSVFFGLSGTGKTTLSADPNRNLIGDDEHGWDEEGVFNFEGGCYAKCINLKKENEPDIYNAIKEGSLLENIVFYENTNKINFTDKSITENTRVSYPINYIKNSLNPSRSGHPKNIFFLTCDASGVLPPISSLNTGQAMYHFLLGYTAKVAGTEEGVKEPQKTFSACFGEPFLPLHPTFYAKLLGGQIEKHNSKVWLINTGWTGGSYGEGSRIKLEHTRNIISAILNDDLKNIEFKKENIFNLNMPKSCPGVPSEILNPINTWKDKNKYIEKAKELSKSFNINFSRFEEYANDEIKKASPNYV